jgi:hypothetical protein
MNLKSILELLNDNPLLLPSVIVSFILFAVFVFILMKFYEARQERRKLREIEELEERGIVTKADRPEGEDGGKETVEKELPKPKSERELTMDNLKSREQRLKEREDRLKNRKMLELQEKERTVERKHVSGIVKEEIKIADEVEQGRELEFKRDENENNRKRLIKLMELAEDRYKDGLMSEKNFRSIMSGYQSELVEVDIELSKLRNQYI